MEPDKRVQSQIDVEVVRFMMVAYDHLQYRIMLPSNEITDSKRAVLRAAADKLGVMIAEGVTR